jgi:hypothetical protein
MMLMFKNPAFKDLCDDDDACLQAMRYWGISMEPGARERVNEYRIIARELEEEITQELSILKSPKPSGSKPIEEREPL